jgi:formate dehydrogenase alpha subunit
MSTGASVSVTVNGWRVKAPRDGMLLSLLRHLGIRVPTLCHDPRLTPYGGCRLCVVARLDPRPGLVPACSTPILRGMVIETDTPEVVEARRRQLGLLAVDHRMECPVCERAGDCRLQDLVHEYGLPDELVRFDRTRLARDERAPVIVRDPEQCIVCGKCVRLCDEVQGVAAIGMAGRGVDTRVATFMDRPLDCEFCGQCVNACPVSALTARPYVGGVPVWLRESTTTTCSFCSCGCQITLQTYGRTLGRVTSNPATLPNHGKLCVKGWLGWDVSSSPERLRRPLVRREGLLTECDWDEALDAVTAALRHASATDRPVVCVGSSRLTTEDAYLMQRFARSVLGSPHVDAGPVGGVGALVGGMAVSTGLPRSTATLEDLQEADLVLVVRGDPTRTHPLVKTELVQAVRQRGHDLVVAHAVSGGLESVASLHLALRPATEVVLLRGVAARLLERNRDLREACAGVPGFAAWSAGVAAYTPEVVTRHTGVDGAVLDSLVARLERTRRFVTVVVTGLGIPGDEVGVTRSACDLDLMLSTWRESGAGVLVLGEKANVQGVIDVGLHPAFLPGHRRVGDAWARAEVEKVWGASVPAESGWIARRAFPRIADQGVGVIYLAGQDPAGGWPLCYEGRRTIREAGFVVVHEAFLTQTARSADVVLPVAILGERNGSVVGMDGVRRSMRKVPSAPDGVPQDGEIFVEIARRLGSPLPAGSALEHEIEALVSWSARSAGDRIFLEVDPPPEPADPPSMLLDASPQLFHSGSVTSWSAELQALSPTVAVRLAPVDAADLGVRTGEMVRVAAGDREMLLSARVDAAVRSGTVVVLWHSKGDSAAAMIQEHSLPVAVDVRRTR